MLKDFAWDTFRSTGNIDAYVFYKEMDKLEQNVIDEKTVFEQEVAVSN